MCDTTKKESDRNSPICTTSVSQSFYTLTPDDQNPSIPCLRDPHFSRFLA